MPDVEINGIKIDYTIAGEGEPLVLIMGMGLGQKGWMFQTRYFRKYFKTIVFDNRGAGNSGKPEGPYSARMMAEDTIGLMDYLHIDRAHILGISLGGMIAQEIAINYPQRVNKLVLGCTFCKQDNGTSGDTPEFKKAVDLALQGTFDPMLDLLLNNKLIKLLYKPIIKKALKKSGKSGAIGLAGQRQAGLTHNTESRLRLIKAPALIIAGTGDRVIKTSSSRFMANLIPGSKLVLIENGSHTLFVEMSKKFNQEVLNFLK
jgi:pimeloyl-ACP methyl ester carboxylesterase